MSKNFSLDFEVRDYELDMYGVVNNAVYSKYLEHARHSLLNTVGINPARMTRDGQALTLSEISLRFRSPLRSGERFRVDVSVEKLAGARFVMTQTIVRLPGLELVLEARVTAVFIDERGRPQRIRADIHQALAPYLASTGDG